MPAPAPNSGSRSCLPGVLVLFSVVFFVIGISMIAASFRGAHAARAEKRDNTGGGGGFFSRFHRGGGDEPADAEYEDGRPVGLYFMTKYWFATRSLEKAVWYFTPDGKVYLDPEDGFSEERLSSHYRDAGEVSANGDELSIKWRNGEVETAKLEKNDGGFAWDTGLYTPVTGFNDASQLVGRWEGGNSVTFADNYTAASATYDLREDGTFTREGVSTFRNEGDGSVASGGATGSSTGHWSLDGYTLTMKYDDGKVQRGITFPFDDEKTKRFYFAGTTYNKL